MSTAAHALLRQLRATSRVRIVKTQYFDPPTGRELWVFTAQSKSAERWISMAEDYYQAACGLAGLMGFELEDG